MIELPGNSYLADLELPKYVTVGKYSSIAANVKFHSLQEEHQWSINHNCVYTTNWDQPTETGKITIGSDVWIGEGVRILPNTEIGDGAIIGAGAVIKGYFPPYAIVIGNPGKITRYRFNYKQIRKLKMIKWWNWEKDKVEENKELMKHIDKFLEIYGKGDW